jgi:hypothetical protein
MAENDLNMTLIISHQYYLEGLQGDFKLNWKNISCGASGNFALPAAFGRKQTCLITTPSGHSHEG